jgi:ketosteroid isomerase-like protein
MIDHNAVNNWLTNYLGAWQSYDPEAIGALFSADAKYRYNPFDEPVRGRDDIVADWLAHRDAPDSFAATYWPVAVDGDVAVANGRTTYFEPDGTTVKQTYDNIFVLKFDQDGRCRDFCEWFAQPRRGEAA